MPEKPKTNTVGSQVKRKMAADSTLPTKSKKLKKVSTPLPPNRKTCHLSTDEIIMSAQSNSSHVYSDVNDDNVITPHNLSGGITYTSTASQTSTPTDQSNSCEDFEELHISLDVSQRASDLVDRIMSLIDCEEEADESVPVVGVDSTPGQNGPLLEQTNDLQYNEPHLPSPIKAHSVSVAESHSSVVNFYGLNEKNSPIHNVNLPKKQNAPGNLKNISFHNEINLEVAIGRSKNKILHGRKAKSLGIEKGVTSENNQGTIITPVPNDLPNINEALVSNRRLSNESQPPDQSGKSLLSVLYALPLKEVKVAPCVDVAFDKMKHLNGIKLTPKKMALDIISAAKDVDVDRVHANANPSQLIQNRKSCTTSASSESLLQGLSINQPQQTKSHMKNTSTGAKRKSDILQNTTNLIEIPHKIHKKIKSKNQVSSPSGKIRTISSAFNSNSVPQDINEIACGSIVDTTKEAKAFPLSQSESTSQYSQKVIDLITSLSSSALANKDISATRSKKQYKESFTALLQPSSYPSLGLGPIPPPNTGKKYVGAHVSAAGGIHKVFENAQTIKASSFAMFMRSQRQWAAKPFEETHLELFRQKAKGFPMHLILPHGSYLMNVGSSNPELLQKSRDLLREELLRCNQLNVPHFNFHPGSCVGGSGRDDCCRTIAESINLAHHEVPRVIVVLENMCRQGNTIGGDFHELRRIIELVDDRSRVGVCLDTCHAHNAGYDLSTEDGFNEMVRDFDTIIGFQFLRGMHVNDSKNAAGAHVDRHECIGKGTIGIEGMRRVMNCPHFDDMPIILETPFTDDAGYAKEIRLLQGLVWAGGSAKEEEAKEEAVGDTVQGTVLSGGEGEGGEMEPAVTDDEKPAVTDDEKPTGNGKGKPAANGKQKHSVHGKGKRTGIGKLKPASNNRGRLAVTGKEKLIVNGKVKPGVPGKGIPDVPGKGIPDVPGKGIPDVPGKVIPDVPGKGKPGVSGKAKPVIDGKSVSNGEVAVNVTPAAKTKVAAAKNKSVKGRKLLSADKPAATGKSPGRGRPKKQPVPSDLKTDEGSSSAPASPTVKVHKLSSADKPAATGKSPGRGRPKKQPVSSDLKTDEGSSSAPAESAAHKLVKTGSTRQKPAVQNIVKKRSKTTVEDASKKAVKSVLKKEKKPLNLVAKNSPKTGPTKRKLVANDTDGTSAKKKKL